MKSNETKQKTMLIQTPSMEKCAIALNQNAENSVRFIRFGQELIRRAEHEGMDEGMADEIRSYNSQCASQIKAIPTANITICCQVSAKIPSVKNSILFSSF